MTNRPSGGCYWETQVCRGRPPPLSLALQLLGVRNGCLIIGFLFLSPTACSWLGSLMYQILAYQGAALGEYLSLPPFWMLSLAHVLRCRSCVLLYKHTDDIVGEMVDFE